MGEDPVYPWKDEVKAKSYNRIPNVGLVDDQTLGEWMVDAVWRRRKADMAAAEYEDRKPKIERGIIKELSKNGNEPPDFSIRKAMENHWTLNDLAKTHAWLRDEANSLNQAIQTQLALRAALAAQESKP